MTGTRSIVSLVSASRSGSTLLSKVLDTLDGVVAVGELQSVWTDGMIEDRVCACSRRYYDCPFWGSVMEAAGLSRSHANEIVEHRRVYGRARTRYPLVVLRGIPRGRAGEAWLAAKTLNDRLVKGILDVSGADVVIDSSPNPLQAMLLHDSPLLGQWAIHLVRRPAAFVYSWMNPKFEPSLEGMMRRDRPAKAAANWFLRNLAIEALRRHMPVSRFRYEDLVDGPSRAFQRLVDVTPPLSGKNLDFASDNTIGVGGDHIFFGNPVRFERGITEIRHDLRYQSGLRLHERALVAGATFPLSIRYGYGLGV